MGNPHHPLHLYMRIFFYPTHHGLMKIVTGEWKLFCLRFGKKSYWKWAEKIPPPFVKMVACFLRDKITTTAIRLCLQDIWIYRLQQYFKNFPSAFKTDSHRDRPRGKDPPPQPPAPVLCGNDQCLGNCTASYVFLFQFRNDIISMR